MSAYVLALLLSVLATVAAILLGRRVLIRPPEQPIGKTEVRSSPVVTTEGIIYALLKESNLFSSSLLTTEEIEIENGSVLYYLIEGEVEVIYNGNLLIKKEKDFFVYSVRWLFNQQMKGRILFRIRKGSLLCQLKKEDQMVRYILINRLLKGTVYTLVNYLEEEIRNLDIKNIYIRRDMPVTEKVELLKKEISLIKSVEEFEEISIDKNFTLKSNHLLFILEGEGEIEYTKDHSYPVKKNDLLGCLERTVPLKNRRKIKILSKITAIKIKLLSTREVKTEELEKVGEETVSLLKNKTQLEITDALIDWRIFQPGEKLSAEIPTRSVKIITNGYFLKEGDVKYFGVSSGNTLFEKEVLLNEPSPFTLTSTRLSEVLEIPKEFIETVTTEFQRSSLGLYKRILQRTGQEKGLEQPSIITFVPNDPKETQLEIFLHFLKVEMSKNDTCKILSVEEIGKKRDLIYLLNYIGDLQREYSYIFIPVTKVEKTSENPTKKSEKSEKSPTPEEKNTPGKKISKTFPETETQPSTTEPSEITLSEIIFYVVTNGDRRTIKINSNIFCKVDTLILHRDSSMRVSPGKYYGQKHNVEFPVIDVPLSLIKRKNSKISKKTHCKLTDNPNTPIPYFPLKDMHRFIRTLKGTNVGLVLGGGGARGIAHIGIIEALEEAKIPIDAIGGTSMGAFVGALYAEDTNNKKVFIRAKRLTSLIGSIWRVLLDLTYPICSIFTGKGFNWALRLIFKNKRIEDLWLPYYCITTDISKFEEVQHMQGILWRYVRASMSLSGYLPPLCDNGSFLLDGGYMNNVPADTMRSMGIRNIIAVDVGSEVETTFSDYGDSINGFYILIQKIFSTKKFLSLTEIQYRLAYLTSMHKERSLKSDVSIKYIRPDLAGYKTMNFRQFDEIVAHGYQYGKRVIEEWKRTGEYLELTALTKVSVKKEIV